LISSPHLPTLSHERSLDKHLTVPALQVHAFEHLKGERRTESSDWVMETGTKQTATNNNY